MSSNTDINQIYRVVVRRGAVGPRPLVWEFRHKLSEYVVRSGAASTVRQHGGSASLWPVSAGAPE